MIKILSLLLLLTGHLQAQTPAQSVEEFYVAEMLRRFDGTIDMTQTVYCYEKFKRLEIEDCSGYEKSQLTIDYNASFARLENLVKQVDNYQLSKKSKKNKARLRKIKRKLSCISRKFLNLKVTCRDSFNLICRDSYAYAHFFRSSIMNMFLPNEIFVCPTFHPLKTEYREAILIHEVSHLCRADDFEYFSEESGYVSKPSQYHSSLDSNKKIDITHLNADTYEYWLRFGFCLPEDC